MATDNDAAETRSPEGPLAILKIFLALGLTSFGGPVAHLGYFRTEFVERRRWLSDAAYADLVALCQFLPGPASSQAGFAIGLMRGGWAGAAAAWAGFTLPSAAVLVLFAYGASALQDPISQGVIGGLKILAVAVVAQAVLGMGRSLAPTGPRLVIALVAIAVHGVFSHPLAQIAVILAGAAAGLALALGQESSPDAAAPPAVGVSRGVGLGLAGTAVGLLVLLPLLVGVGIGGQPLALFEAFYRAGALVFGGGHVVLPLLEGSVVGPGWVDPDTFLAGYGAAQAVPGPLFTFAAYLGAAAGPEPNGVAGAAIALVAIFVPGLLLVAGLLPWWERFRSVVWARSVLAGVNAAVVGVLAAALYDPVFTAGVRDGLDFALAAAAFFALTVWKAPVWGVVLAMGVAGGAIGAAGL
ncbi:MAG: chromate efflux transporter [Paracoccaceae bacterium]